MRQAKKTGITYSGILHAVLILVAVVGLPVIMLRKPPPEPMAITVDIVPIGAVSNIKPSEEEPKKEEPKEEPKKEEAKKAAPATKKEEAPPPPPKVEEKPAPVPKKEEPKKEEVKKPEEKKDKKQKEDDLLAILKSVKEQAKKEQKDKPDKDAKESAAKSKSDVPYDPTMPLSLSVKDAIRQQIYKCWSVPAGAKNASDLIVVIEMTRNRDGSLIEAKYTRETQQKMKDPFYRSAAEAAMRAVQMPDCNPLKDMPVDKYEAWSWMEFTFNPKDMLY